MANNRPKCGARGKTTGKPCGREAGWGTLHPGFGQCKYHGGSTAVGGVHAARVEAQQVLDKMPILGGIVLTDPNAALLMLIGRSAGMIGWLELKIQTLEIGQLTQGSGLDGMGPTIPAVWIKIHADERDRLARVSKMAIDAGVSERTVQIAEEQGLMIARLLQGVLRDLQLTAEQAERAPGIVRQYLLAPVEVQESGYAG